MLRRSGLTLKAFGYKLKYPSVVSYSKFPWGLLSMDSPQVHQHAAQHYEQLLQLSASISVPNLALPDHLPIPEEHWQSVLPGTFYILKLPKETTSIAQSSPFEWEYKTVDDELSNSYYGPLQSRFGAVEEVVSFSSPDLRLICNGVSIAPHEVMLKNGFMANSSLDSLQLQSGDRIGIFHFFRPNRPPAEMARAFHKYYIHYPTNSLIDQYLSPKDAQIGGKKNNSSQQLSWTPVLEAPKRSAKDKAAPMPFIPPTSYLAGLPERKAIQPGGCFGSRALMWGYYF